MYNIIILKKLGIWSTLECVTCRKPKHFYIDKCGTACVCQFTHLWSYVKMRPSQNASGVTLWYCTLSFIASEPKAVWPCYLEQCCVVDTWNIFLKKLKVYIVICFRSKVTLVRLCCLTLNLGMCHRIGTSVASNWA